MCVHMNRHAHVYECLCVRACVYQADIMLEKRGEQDDGPVPENSMALSMSADALGLADPEIQGLAKNHSNVSVRQVLACSQISLCI